MNKAEQKAILRELAAELHSRAFCMDKTTQVIVPEVVSFDDLFEASAQHVPVGDMFDPKPAAFHIQGDGYRVPVRDTCSLLGGAFCSLTVKPSQRLIDAICAKVNCPGKLESLYFQLVPIYGTNKYKDCFALELVYGHSVRIVHTVAFLAPSEIPWTEPHPHYGSHKALLSYCPTRWDDAHPLKARLIASVKAEAA